MEKIKDCEMKSMVLTPVRCECGKLIGRIAGQFDIRCRCGRVVAGDTATGNTVCRETTHKLPRDMLGVSK